jgi:hypothetical protein
MLSTSASRHLLRQQVLGDLRHPRSQLLGKISHDRVHVPADYGVRVLVAVIPRSRLVHGFSFQLWASKSRVPDSTPIIR